MMPGSTIRLFGVMISVGTPKNTSGEAADNTVDNGSTSTEHNKEKQVRDLEGHGSPRKKARNEQDSNLRCPRCNSHETRFCYYNNKNEGQPRYLCKNCMRFWTAGGRQRNIPVGAAKRKTKSSTSPQRHNLFIPQGLQSCCLDVLNLDQTSSASSSSFSSHRPVLMGEGYICSSPAMAAISTAIRMEGPSSGPPAPLLPHLQRFHGVLCAGLWNPIRYTAITSFAVRDETDNSGLAPSDEDLSRINFL